jgi:hypothetical protein
MEKGAAQRRPLRVRLGKPGRLGRLAGTPKEFCERACAVPIRWHRIVGFADHKSALTAARW